MALSTAFDPVFAQHLAELEKRALAAGIPTHLISGFRTRQDQEELYANFLAGQKGEPLPYPARGAVPMAAPAGSSKHERGVAADLVSDDPSQQAKLIALSASDPYFRTIKGDPSHFEAAGGDGSAIASAAPVSTGGVNASARGMRNNNPGNLVANAWTSTLPGYKGSDGKFAIFDTLENGTAALDRNLSSYGSKGIHTPLAIASTWAPAGDNNDPNSYGATIAKALGVGPNDTVDMNDPKVRAKVAEAITRVENGPGNAPAGGSGTAVASTQPNQPAPDDWQKLLGAEEPPAPADLGSIMGGLRSRWAWGVLETPACPISATRKRRRSSCPRSPPRAPRPKTLARATRRASRRGVRWLRWPTCSRSRRSVSRRA